MAQTDVLDDIFGKLLELEADRKRPPVSAWHPALSGRIDIRIAADGTWYHEGDPIKRAPLVRLFASILRRESDGEHYLITPVEKWRIEVEDAPLVAVDLEVRGAGPDRQILFVTNVGEVVLADKDHQLVVRGSQDAPRPYIYVRDGLEALIARSAWYHLTDQADIEGSEIVVYSCGSRFVIGSI